MIYSDAEDSDNDTLNAIIKRITGPEMVQIPYGKATESDYGTDTGWDSSYGDGQAVFSRWEIVESYYVFDSQVGGGPDNWRTGFMRDFIKQC